MQDLNRNLKNYKYINTEKIRNLYFQSMDNIFKKIKYKLSVNFHGVNATIDIDTKSIEIHRQIIEVYEYLKKHKYLFEAEDNLRYNKDYYTLENVYLRKVLIDGSKIETSYQDDKINIWIAETRSFSRFGSKSPLILVSDNLPDSFGKMDGSSGYSIFKQLMEDYLKCGDVFIKQIPDKTKTDFPLDPLKYFKEIGCTISDQIYCEVLWEKRSILKDDIHNLVYTFAYPLFIAKELRNE